MRIQVSLRVYGAWLKASSNYIASQNYITWIPIRYSVLSMLEGKYSALTFIVCLFGNLFRNLLHGLTMHVAHSASAEQVYACISVRLRGVREHIRSMHVRVCVRVERESARARERRYKGRERGQASGRNGSVQSVDLCKSVDL